MPQYFILAVLGLVWGSFLNVLIYRLPQTALSGGGGDAPGPWFFAWPPSFCPRCKAPIRALHNIPLLSFIVLRGKCATCGKGISFRYPLVEALGALAAAAAVWQFGATWTAALALLFVSALIVIAVIDAERLIVPDSVVLPLAMLGLLANLDGRFAPLSSAVIGAVGGYAALFAAAYLFSLILRREAMGRGDIKLFAALGAWLGAADLPFVLFGGAAFGALFATAARYLLPARSRLRRRMTRGGYFSFAAFLSPAAILMLFFGDEIAGRYLSLIGL